MLDHDELLAEEHASPDLVQELQATYRLSPAEEQVLARVHQRLAQSSHVLPLPEPVQAERPLRLLPPVAAEVRPGAPATRSTKARLKWVRTFNTLAAVLLVGLLVGTLALTFSRLRSTAGSPPPAVVVNKDSPILLTPTQSGKVLSQAEVRTISALLVQRFHSFGLQGVGVFEIVTNGRPAIAVQLPHGNKVEKQALNILLEIGALDFWGTDSNAVPLHTSFNPNLYSKYNPGGKPVLTNRDIDLSSLQVAQDVAVRPQINVMLRDAGSKSFQLYTASHVGLYLTITLDGKALESAVIQSQINGQLVITSDFTEQQARAIVAVLKAGPLPVELKMAS